MRPPEMAGWNLALRFGLELAAFTGLAMAAWRLSPGGLRWVAVWAVPLVAATIWGVFNVIDDPSRSGEAPVEVAGSTRLAIELAVLGGGAAAFAVSQQPMLSLGIALLITVHYTMAWNRVEWLVRT